MKRFSLFALASCFVLSAQAALTSWVVASSQSVTSSYVDGMAYLIEVKSNGPSLQNMVDAIKTNGLHQTSTSVALKGYANIEENAGERLAEYNGKGGAWVETTVDTQATYYVLLVDSEGANFLFTNGLTTSDEAFSYNNNPPVEVANPLFEEQDMAWANNGGVVGAPEPTALALLALGVAGLALKRRAA